MDLSYQGLMNAMTPQVPPSQTPLMDGLNPGLDPFSLAQMRAKQAQQQDPRVFMREVNPGQAWGGRDQNMVTPDNVMQSYYTPPPPEPI